MFFFFGKPKHPAKQYIFCFFRVSVSKQSIKNVIKNSYACSVLLITVREAVRRVKVYKDVALNDHRYPHLILGTDSSKPLMLHTYVR